MVSNTALNTSIIANEFVWIGASAVLLVGSVDGMDGSSKGGDLSHIFTDTERCRGREAVSIFGVAHADAPRANDLRDHRKTGVHARSFPFDIFVCGIDRLFRQSVEHDRTAKRLAMRQQRARVGFSFDRAGLCFDGGCIHARFSLHSHARLRFDAASWDSASAAHGVGGRCGRSSCEVRMRSIARTVSMDRVRLHIVPERFDHPFALAGPAFAQKIPLGHSILAARPS